MSSFMEMAVNGDVLLEEIDDFVDVWHDNETGGSLHSFLGMTPEEYAIWVDNNAMLPQLVAARHQGVSVAAFNSYYAEQRLAARAERSQVVREIAGWLEARNGRKT